MHFKKQGKQGSLGGVFLLLSLVLLSGNKLSLLRFLFSREKFAEQTISNKILGVQNAFKLIQLVGLFLKIKFGKLDFGLESKHYSGVFFFKKRHYRYPIVLFSINATIGTKKTPLQCLLSSPKSNLPNSTFKKSPTN